MPQIGYEFNYHEDWSIAADDADKASIKVLNLADLLVGLLEELYIHF